MTTSLRLKNDKRLRDKFFTAESYQHPAKRGIMVGCKYIKPTSHLVPVVARLSQLALGYVVRVTPGIEALYHASLSIVSALAVATPSSFQRGVLLKDVGDSVVKPVKTNTSPRSRVSVQ